MKKCVCRSIILICLMFVVAAPLFGMQAPAEEDKAPQPPKRRVRIVTPDDRTILNNTLLREACMQGSKRVIELLHAGADPEASNDRCGRWHSTFLHIVAGWEDQSAIKNVLAHLKKTMARGAFEKLLEQRCSCNHKPYELAARNVWGPAAAYFFQATDNKDRLCAMLESDDLWYNAIVYGHIANVSYLLKLLRDSGSLNEFLLKKCIEENSPLHLAVRWVRDEVVVVMLNAVDAATMAQMLALKNVQGLTVKQVAGCDSMRAVLDLYCDDAL